jgi:hypothetical protein
MLLRSVVGGATRRAQQTMCKVAKLAARRLDWSPSISPKHLPRLARHQQKLANNQIDLGRRSFQTPISTTWAGGSVQHGLSDVGHRHR